MQKIIVIDKATMEKVEIDSNIIKLEKGSIIQTKILREDVAEIIQDGNNLIIKMKDGEILTIENYFVVDAEGNNTALVFEGTECAFLLLDWQNGVAGFKELAGLEELLPIAVGGGSTASNLLPWIVGGALVGGTVIAVDGSNGSSKDQPKVPEVPIAAVVTINPVVPDKDGTTTITGTVNNPNADVIVTLDGKEYKAKVDPTPNADGTYNWTVDVPTSALPPQGEEVPVKGTITDPNTGLVSPPGIDEAPVILPPKAPVVTIDQVVPDKDGTTAITGIVDNPNADVTITIGGKEYPVNVDPTPNEDGTYNWTVDVPTNKLPPIGQEIPVKATVTDPNTGLISEPGQDEAPVVVPPKAPYVTIDPIVPSEDDTTTITGTVDDPNADVTVTVGGKEYPVKVDPTPNDDGTYNWIVDVPTAELPPVGQEVPVKGTVTDPNTGLVSEPGTDETLIPNTGVIPAPKVEITTDINNNGVINGTELGHGPDVSVKITIPKEAKVGDTLTIIINGGEPTDIIITDDMLKNGYITSVPPQANGKVDVAATITDQTGNTSGKGGDTAVIDTKPPAVIVIINDDGTVTFKFNEPVKNFDLSDIVISGGKLSNLVENKDGTWFADLTGTKQGITVNVGVKDKSYTNLAGNEGSSGTDKKVTVKIDSIIPDGNTAIISGTTEPGNKVTVTLPDGSTLVSEPADLDGYWTVTTDKPLVDGNTVDAVTDDQDGKPTSDDVLLPFVSIDIVGGDDIINEGELSELTDFDGNITITGTVSNPSASMTITFNGKVYSGDQVTVNADGTWSIKVPASDVLSNNDIKAQGSVVGADGTLIESNVAERPVGQDLTPPNVDVEITAKAEIIIQFDPDVDPSTIDPKEFIIVDKNGNPVKVELIPSKDGLTWTGKVPSGVDGDIKVTVPENSYKDYAGNLGGQGTANKDVDTTAPSVEVDIIANAKDETSAKATFTFSEDIDPSTFSSADLNVTGGRVVGEPKQNADGTWTVELKVEPGQTVKVEVKDDSYTDLDGNKGSGNDDSLITIKINQVTPSTDANGKPITNITGQTEPGNEVVVTLPNGTKLPPVIADKDGKWTVTTDIPLNDGDDIDATTTNQDGNPIDDAVLLPLISIDVVAGDDVVNEKELIDLTTDGLFTITGTVSNPNADITVTFNGKEYNIPAKDITSDGKWSLKVPANEIGTSNSITAVAKTDVVESVPAIRNPVLDNEPPTVQVSINDKGEITIKYAPDVDPSTIDPKEIVIKDEDGKRIKVELTPSEDGLTWTGKFPTGIDGNVSVTVPDNSYADKSGNLGGQGIANKDVDTTAPSVEVDIIANAKDETSATATFTFSEDIDPSTFSSADLNVTGGRVVGEPKQNADGTWTVELKVEPGQTVKVEVKDDSYTDLDGNKGSGNDDSLITIKINQVTPSTDANGKPITNITGQTEPGNEVVVTLPNGTKLPPVIADKDGKWTVTTDIPLNDGDDIDATTTNQDGNPIDDAVLLPLISIDVIAGDDVVNEKELIDLTTDGLFTITGTVSNPNADITVTFNGKEYKIPAKDITSDGKWSLKVPANEIGTSNSITAVAKTDVVESVPAIRNPVLDNEPPTVQVSINDKGEITIKYAPDVDPSTIDPKEIVIKDEDGKRIKVELTPSEDGLTWTGKFPTGIDGNVSVTVPDNSYADKSGNLGGQGIANKDVDTTPPQVTVKVDEDGNITLTYPDDVDPDSITTDKITVKDENGKDIPVIFEKQPDGSYTAQVPPGTDGTVKVEVPAGSYDDLTGNPGLIGKGEGPVDTTPPQVTVKVDEDGNITLTYPDDVDPDSITTDKITVKDENGKDIPVIFEKQPDGSYTAQVPPGTDGTVKVEVPAGSYDDLTGNPGLIGKGEGPVDTTPPQVTVKVDEDGNITLTYPDDVDPDSITTDKITVKDENGKDIPVIFEKQPDGSYTAQVPPGTDGTVKVEVPAGSYDDLTGNPGLIGKGEGPVDTTPPQVTVKVDEEGNITLTYPDDVDPDSITTDKITVKDEGGKDIPMIFEKQPDGSYTAQVPPGTDGTVKVEVPAGSYDDLTGNPGLIGKGEGPVDTTPPQVTVKVDEDGNITLTYPDDVDPDSITTDKITVKDENGKDIPVIFEKQPDGSYTAQVPPGTDGTVKVEVPAGSYDDLTGNPGLIGKGEGPVDTTPPQVTVKVDEDGNITLTYPDDVDPDSITTDKITVKDENGKDIPVIFEKQPDGSYTAQVPPGTDGTVKVEVPAGSYDDLTGNPGLIGKGEGPVDTTPPQVTVKVDEEGNITLTYPDDVDPDSITTDKITVKDEGGKDIPMIFEKQPDGSYTAQVPPGTDGTVKVEVPAGSYDDLTGNPGLIGKGEGPVDTTPPQVTVKVDEDGNITLTYPDDVDPDSITTDKITVKDENGKDIPVIFEKQPDGSYTAQVPPGTDGTVKVEVPAGSYDDLTGNPGLIGKGEGPVDTTPPQVTVKVDEDGNITLTYPDDVDPDSITTDKITVKDENGKDIPVIFEKQPDGSYTAQVPPGTDGTVKVEVPAGSYDDLTGNPGLIGKGEGPVDTVAPIVNPTSVITNEDQSVVLKWAHFGITDANTTNANLMVTITHLPTDGTLYYTNASGNKVAITNGQKLTYADIDSGKVTFEPDANEASNNAGDTYADVGFSVSDGKHTTDGSIEIIVDAVADKPNLGFGLVEWEPATVNLNIKTWSNLKEVTIGGKKHTLTGGGSGVSDVTLKTVFEYLTSNQATNPAISEGKTNSLSNGNVPTYNGVAIEGYVYLEAGHTYRYQGKADDSGLLIIGNNDPAYVSWGGSSTSVNKDFTVTESGFYTFDFYMHNQSGEGNYDFQLKDLGGDKISYFPDLKTAIDMMNKVYQGENSSVEWTVSDLIQKDAADKDQYGFHRPYFNLSGEVGKDISLGLLSTGLNDKDGSESLSLAFEGLVEGMQIYAIAQDGIRTLLGTADANGILKFSTTDLSINGQSLVAVAPKNYIVSGASDTLDVKVTATATEQSNGSEASTETDFDIILYPPTGVAAKALLAMPIEDDNIIFDLLSDTNTGGNTLRIEDNFSVGSYAQIDLSALLSDAATLNNLGEYVSVNYDANTDQAVISIDRDGAASAYQSQDLLILTHQTTDVTLNDLLKNNQIII